MKKRMVFLALFLLTASALAGASANSWGLTGKLLNAVMADPAWDDYSVLGRQEGPFAVMQTRYHNALFFAGPDGGLHVYTTAVYQPEDRRKAPELYWDGHYLRIWYGEDEYYTFCEWNEGSGEYQLSEACIHDFQVTGIPGENGFSWNYEAADDESGETLVLPERILLSNFNIRLFPHSAGEVRHRNYMKARFDSGLTVLGYAAGTGDPYDADHPGEPLETGKKGTAAVYSAPFRTSAWRAGKGKAAVGLEGRIWLLSQFKNAEGQSYACIRYDVSERTQRIGYALCSELGLPEITEQPEEPGNSFVHIDAEATADTFLTDDPDVSQYPQFTVPKGTLFSCLGLYNNEYAYAAAEVRDGKFTDGGAVVWGFVPVRDLAPTEQEKPAGVTEQLEGDWILEAGGTLAPDVLRFRADGTFTSGIGRMSGGEVTVTEGAQSGTWYVTAYNPFMNLYWDRPPYEITLLFDNGGAVVRGLTLTDEGFSLTYWEGGAGYVPWDGMPYSDGDHG